ncbi:flagellar hook-basal body complex protein FliE [Shewanella corallii]|uniref:Flagellar hook-basal body complex protein FliE n=2 Tax=Shewanella TaxID=22 RepID=A0ABT0N9G2_9GAMM|nr:MULTISPECIES: flagellar hook-basal body complex protein FliE [Shewanella]MCL1038744.1 flagellar hook-basal body complex protein FliE [Shewanella submarina]MCL2915059.1 flagellar hook-basal body complex protein FliE [Shewanella corallii]
MSLPLNTTATDMLQTMQVHQELAKGAIKPSNIFAEQAVTVSFSDLMKQKVSAVNQDQLVSGAMTRAVDTGESDDLVGAMVASQKASLSFAALMQIRNRLVQAFDDVMKMPI